MHRTLPLTQISLLFAALLAGCGEAPKPDAKSGEPQTCPAGYFWNGKECEKQRTIILEEGKPGDPPPPPPPPK